MEWYYVVVSHSATSRFLGYVDWDESIGSAILTHSKAEASRWKDESTALDVMRRATLDGTPGNLSVEQRRM